MLTLSSLACTAKKYALDSSISDEAFLNALLDPYVQEGRIKGRMGVDFHLDKFRTSKILNGKADVPKQLRKALARFGLEGRVSMAFKPFLEEYLDASCFDCLATDVMAMVCKEPGDAALKKELASMTEDPASFLAHSLVAAIKANNLRSEAKTIWQNGTGLLAIEVGDLLDKGFGKAKKCKDIIAIPVNTTFDTEVSWSYEKTLAPMVSERSIHGQWLVRMFKCGQTSNDLKKRINDDLAFRYGDDGSEWPIGAVAVIENDRAIFFLVAISSFDQKNNAHSTPVLVECALEKLLRTYDECGQGMDMYIPLFGTGLSRASLSHDESLNLIERVLLKNKAIVHSKITIMIYPNDVPKLSDDF